VTLVILRIFWTPERVQCRLDTFELGLIDRLPHVLAGFGVVVGADACTIDQEIFRWAALGGIAARGIAPTLKPVRDHCLEPLDVLCALSVNAHFKEIDANLP
jgi:hypothetical protein